MLQDDDDKHDDLMSHDDEDHDDGYGGNDDPNEDYDDDHVSLSSHGNYWLWFSWRYRYDCYCQQAIP